MGNKENIDIQKDFLIDFDQLDLSELANKILTVHFLKKIDGEVTRVATSQISLWMLIEKNIKNN